MNSVVAASLTFQRLATTRGVPAYRNARVSPATLSAQELPEPGLTSGQDNEIGIELEREDVLDPQNAVLLAGWRERDARTLRPRLVDERVRGEMDAFIRGEVFLLDRSLRGLAAQVRCALRYGLNNQRLQR